MDALKGPRNLISLNTLFFRRPVDTYYCQITEVDASHSADTFVQHLANNNNDKNSSFKKSL